VRPARRPNAISPRLHSQALVLTRFILYFSISDTINQIRLPRISALAGNVKGRLFRMAKYLSHSNSERIYNVRTFSRACCKIVVEL
jgi:hypothetical protein